MLNNTPPGLARSNKPAPFSLPEFSSPPFFPVKGKAAAATATNKRPRRGKQAEYFACLQLHGFHRLEYISRMSTDPFELIRDAKFFGGLSEAACKQLAELSQRRTIEKRDLLFMEGSEGKAIYLLTSGSLQLVKTNLEGKETVIKTVKEGELFAEVILFEKPRYPVTAIARTDIEVIELPRAGFLKLLDERDFRKDFMAMLMAKQRYLAERIQQLTSMDVEARFVEFLRDHYGTKQPITPDLSKKDIASAIGATPETFSRLLQRLEKRGDFRWKGKSIEVTPEFWDTF